MQKMDKYEFNVKVEQLRKLVKKEDYETALKIVEAIDWKKVRNANLLSLVAQVYEKCGVYDEAKGILLMAFERAPIGKRLLCKLVELALKQGEIDEAEAYYREFLDITENDPRRHLLRYMILKEKKAPLEQLIQSLKCYTDEELDEKWLYKLAELYHMAGEEDLCVKTCDKIMLMFGLGTYVDMAMELKIQYAPLAKYQMDLVENRDKYEEKLREVEQKSLNGSLDSLNIEEVVEEEQELELDPEVAAELESELGEEEEIQENDQEEASIGIVGKTYKNHIMIEAKTPEKGLEKALSTLKQIQEETGIKNQVAKIGGTKLNSLGIFANVEKLNGKDLLVTEAGDLTEKLLREIGTLIEKDATGMRVIFIDNPRQIQLIHEKNPGIASYFECIGSSEDPEPEVVIKEDLDTRPIRLIKPIRPVQMNIDDFANYACEYAAKIDCSITGKSMLALYECIEIMKTDNMPLTKEAAEQLVEDAADRAEKPSVGKKIKGIFSSKYDKDGLLILKEEHFI